MLIIKQTPIQKYQKSDKGKLALKKAVLKYYHKQRSELIEFLGNKCVRCRFSDFRALQFDHINGGGNKEYKKFGNNEVVRFYNKHRDLAKKRLQILCANCNWIKKHEENEV